MDYYETGLVEVSILTRETSITRMIVYSQESISSELYHDSTQTSYSINGWSSLPSSLGNKEVKILLPQTEVPEVEWSGDAKTQITY